MPAPVPSDGAALGADRSTDAHGAGGDAGVETTIHVTRGRAASGSIGSRAPRTYSPPPPSPPSAAPSPRSVRKIAVPSLPSALPPSAPPVPRPTSAPRATPAETPITTDPPVGKPVHPRDLVPQDVGFPTPPFAVHIQAADQADRLLMAICSVCLSAENRALCPKEIAEVLFQRGWLHNAGTTPFAHVSTCIRSHLRRAAMANYTPILSSYELLGALNAQHEIRAVGLRADERPAVKRGTLWFLNERVFGRGIGADDPFVAGRLEAGIEWEGAYEQDGSGSGAFLHTAPTLPVEDAEGKLGMGRGKRKRRASIAALAMGEPSDPIIAALFPVFVAPSSAPATLPTTNRRGSLVSPSSPANSAVPRLRLRLTSLEEVDSMDDSDAGSDVQTRHKTKKKVRRAVSEGGYSAGLLSGESLPQEEDTVDLQPVVARRSTFSSISSSALLAQSLLAASTPASPLTSLLSVSFNPAVSNISPGSLHFSSPTFRRPHLSASAPTLFSAFPPLLSPDMMELDSRRHASEEPADSADEGDIHESMLRGEGFDFEWGSESYTSGHVILPSFSHKSLYRARGREPSLPLIDFPEEPNDAASTPATTPRSPPHNEEDLESSVGSLKCGMEATLCQAFEGEPVDTKPILALIIDRTPSTESLTSLADDEPDPSPPSTLTRQLVDSSTLVVPLASPLSLELPPLLSLAHGTSPDFDFVGLADDDDRSAYRNPYDRTESPDEDEADDIRTIKLEDEGSVGPETDSVNSSRASSAYPTDSFASRLTVHNSSSSGSSSDDEHFDSEIVSGLILASGLPVPQPAPSPPATGDWGMHLDPDELDMDLGSELNMLGPESVGMDELDLAWGGSAERAPGETEEEWATRREAREQDREKRPQRTFLTRSLAGPFTPLVSPKEDVNALVMPDLTSLPLPAPTIVAHPSARSSTASAFFTTQGSPLIVYPTIPLTPSITALIVQKGVAVFATTVVEAGEFGEGERPTAYPLLRKIDSSYVNGTVLLKGSGAALDVRLAILKKVDHSFTVSTGTATAGLEGTWIPLPAARAIAARYPSLAQYAVFLEVELGARFPDPISSMRARTSTALPSLPKLKTSPSPAPVSIAPAPVAAPAIVSTRPQRAGRGQRTSGASAGLDMSEERRKERDDRDSSPEEEEVAPVRPPVGRSRRMVGGRAGGRAGGRNGSE